MARNNNETYLVLWGSSANGGSDQGSGGDAGGGSAWNLSRGNGAIGVLAVSIQESLHSATDHPIRWQEYQFFASIPTNAYGIFFALGDAGSVGVLTSKVSTKNNPPAATGTSASATTSGYTLPSKPSIGNVVVVGLTVRGGVTASTPTDSSGEPYTLIHHSTSPGSLNHYLWARVALANDANFVVTAALSGSADWALGTIIVDTPSSTTLTKLDERAFVNNGGNPLRMTLTEQDAPPTGSAAGGVFLGSVAASVTDPAAVAGAATGGVFRGSVAASVIEPVAGAATGGVFLGSVVGSATGSAPVAGSATGGVFLGSVSTTLIEPVAGESDGGVLVGTARGVVIAPFPPVPPIPAMTGVLGCGIYDVFIFDRGLATIVGRIPFNQLQWERVLDDTSTAQVTINGVSNSGAMARCCALLGAVTPWEHEIGIYRDGLRVWSGPVMDVTFPSETVVIDAADLSAWLSVRWLHDNHNDVQQDLATIWATYVADAMSVDNTAGLFATVQALTGVLADRLYTQDMGTFASDAIAELARTGLDWACVDRVMTGGPVALQPPAFTDAPAVPTLIDESFRTAPTVLRSGALMGNAIFVGGSGAGPGGGTIFGQYGPHFPATPDHVESPAAPDYAAIEAIYGRIERRVNETKILDQPSIDQNAATRYDLLKVAVDVISDGTLLPTAGIDMRQLIPGSLQNIHLQRACVRIGAPYRLKKLTVTAANDGSEDVTGAWEPVGSTAAHEDL